MATAAEVEAETRRVNSKISDVQRQTAEVLRKAGQVRQRADSVRAQESRAQHELSQVESRSRSLDSEIAGLNRDLARAQRDLESANSVINQKTTEKTRVARELSDAIQELFKLTSRISEETRAVNALRSLQTTINHLQGQLASLDSRVCNAPAGIEELRIHGQWLTDFRTNVELHAPEFSLVRNLTTYKTALQKVMTFRQSISLTAEAKRVTRVAVDDISSTISQIAVLHTQIRATAESLGVAVTRWISPNSEILSVLKRLDNLVYRLQESLEGQRSVIQKRMIARDDLRDQVILMWRTLLRLRLHAANVEEAGQIILLVESSFFSAEFLSWLHWWLRSGRLTIERNLFEEFCPLHALRDAQIYENIVRTSLESLDAYPLSDAGKLQALTILEEYRDVIRRLMNEAQYSSVSEAAQILHEWKRRLARYRFEPESQCALLSGDVTATTELTLQVETTYLRIRTLSVV